MNNLKLLAGISCLLIVLCSCDKVADSSKQNSQQDQEIVFNEEVEQALQKWIPEKFRNGKAKKLKASFFTEQDLADPRLGVEGGNCEDPIYPFFNVQKGEGSANVIGKFRTEITFCAKPPAEGDLTVDYKGGKGTFYIEDGHELYIEIPTGVVKLISPPTEFQATFQDRFIITGGTGPYKNAAGVGMTDSFVKFLPEGGDRTQHSWYAYVILD